MLPEQDDNGRFEHEEAVVGREASSVYSDAEGQQEDVKEL